MRRLTILLATVGALMLVPVAQAVGAATIKVNIAGPGSGEVNSLLGWSGTGFLTGEPPIECSGPPATGVCETTMSQEFGFEGIGMDAIPAPGSVLVGWTVQKGTPLGEGDCLSHVVSGAERCQFVGEEGTVENAEVTAHFGLAPKLTVAPEGTGSGTVVSSPKGISCGETCSAEYPEGTVVTLTASPSVGSTFISWKGCDKGGANGRKCTVTMSAVKKVSAKFTKTYNVALTKTGSGLGKVSSSPGGVLCLNNCASATSAFLENASVTLSAVPAKHHVFVGWTGGGCSGTGTCVLSMTEDQSVEAQFEPATQFLLDVSKLGKGSGTVKSSLAGISCGLTCSAVAASYYEGDVVTLTATPGKGSTFSFWTTIGTSGPACGTSPTCEVTMTDATSVVANFN